MITTNQGTHVTYGSGRIVGYQYDPLGNLTQKVDNGTADNYTANALNQYTFINSQALSYDAKGNLRQRPGWAYTWDAHNRLRSAAPASPQSGSLRLTFSYDGRNRCATGPHGVCGHGDEHGAQRVERGTLCPHPRAIFRAAVGR